MYDKGIVVLDKNVKWHENRINTELLTLLVYVEKDNKIAALTLHIGKTVKPTQLLTCFLTLISM